MRERRAGQLLVATALAEGEPAGARVEGLIPPAARAAFEAGALEEGLRRSGFSADLVALGLCWPAALRPALERLRALPPALVFHAPLLQTLAYFTFIVAAQCFVLAVLHGKVLPSLWALAPSVEAQSTLYLGIGEVLFLVFSLGFGAAAALGTRPTGLGATWNRSRLRAKEACFALALLDSDAPAAARAQFARSCEALRGEGADARELEAVVVHALGAATTAHRRFVSVTRLVGFGVLLVLALGATASVYLSLPLLLEAQ